MRLGTRLILGAMPGCASGLSAGIVLPFIIKPQATGVVNANVAQLY